MRSWNLDKFNVFVLTLCRKNWKLSRVGMTGHIDILSIFGKALSQVSERTRQRTLDLVHTLVRGRSRDRSPSGGMGWVSVSVSSWLYLPSEDLHWLLRLF